MCMSCSIFFFFWRCPHNISRGCECRKNNRKVNVWCNCYNFLVQKVFRSAFSISQVFVAICLFFWIYATIINVCIGISLVFSPALIKLWLRTFSGWNFGRHKRSFRGTAPYSNISSIDHPYSLDFFLKKPFTARTPYYFGRAAPLLFWELY